jgi:hypothetical protein
MPPPDQKLASNSTFFSSLFYSLRYSIIFFTEQIRRTNKLRRISGFSAEFTDNLDRWLVGTHSIQKPGSKDCITG